MSPKKDEPQSKVPHPSEQAESIVNDAFAGIIQSQINGSVEVHFDNTTEELSLEESLGHFNVDVSIPYNLLLDLKKEFQKSNGIEKILEDLTGFQRPRNVLEELQYMVILSMLTATNTAMEECLETGEHILKNIFNVSCLQEFTISRAIDDEADDEN